MEIAVVMIAAGLLIRGLNQVGEVQVHDAAMTSIELQQAINLLLSYDLSSDI